MNPQGIGNDRKGAQNTRTFALARSFYLIKNLETFQVIIKT